MDPVFILEWFATIFSIIGGMLIVYKRWYGFVIWIFTNAAWIIVGFLTGAYGLSVTFMFFEFINVLGIYEWKIKPNKKTILLTHEQVFGHHYHAKRK